MDIIVEFYTTTSLPEDLGCPQGDVEGSIEVDREENVDNKWCELAPPEVVHAEWLHPTAQT